MRGTEAETRKEYELMNYLDQAEQLLLARDQTEVPYSTDAMERIAAAQVLALLALAEAIKDLRRGE
jgi:hypothetical protein